MRLSRLHYYRSLLIDYGWRPWRTLIELQNRRYQACSHFNDGINRRRFWKIWKAQLFLRCNSIVIAQKMSRVVTCRWALRKWRFALLRVTESIWDIQRRRAIRSWCAFMKIQLKQHCQLGDSSRLKKYWALWESHYRGSKQNKYRQNLLQKVHGWLKQDSLAKII